MTHLDNTTLNRLRQQLEDRHAELRRQISDELARSEDEHYADLAGRVHDSGDEAVADLLTDLSIATVDRQIQEIREIDAALQRMNAATYGYCDACGGEIAIERLESYPTALRCIDCQTRWEQSHAHSDTPRL